MVRTTDLLITNLTYFMSLNYYSGRRILEKNAAMVRCCDGEARFQENTLDNMSSVPNISTSGYNFLQD